MNLEDVRRQQFRRAAPIAARGRSEDVDSSPEPRRAEENPGKRNEMEGQQYAKPPGHPIKPRPVQSLFGHVNGRYGNSVQHAPNDEGPARSMPQPAERHGDEDIAHLTEPARPIAAEWNVEVIAQPERQRDVPPPPEGDDGTCAIGLQEIIRQPDGLIGPN
jgi:hypothetical protein